MILQPAISVLQKIFELWDRHSVPRLAAALAFYAMLSLAPFLVLMVGASAMVFGGRLKNEYAIQDLRGVIGSEPALLIASLLTDARSGTSGTALSGIVAVVLLFFGASNAFVELRSALNYIWNVTEHSSSMVEGFLKDRFLAFLMTCLLGILLLASFGASVIVATFQSLLAHLLVVPPVAVEAGNLLATLAITTLVFLLIFRYVAAIRIPWKTAFVAGFATAVLFILARVPLDLYLSHAVAGSSYGAAASTVVFLMWMYIAAQIFYLGGEFAGVLEDLGRKGLTST